MERFEDIVFDIVSRASETFYDPHLEGIFRPFATPRHLLS